MVIEISHFAKTALTLGPLEIKWYGIVYATCLIVGYFLAHFLVRKGPLNPSNLDQYCNAWILCTIIGARLGEVFFYNFDYFLANPIKILYIWEGGMSFHGGLVGVAMLVAYMLAKRGVRFTSSFIDLIALPAAIAISMGRIANFINDGMYGTPTDLPWSVITPGGGIIPRHPSQLYASFLEGILPAIILTYILCNGKKILIRKPGYLAGLYIIMNGAGRCISDVFKQTHEPLLLGAVTRGQVLSILTILIGILILYLCNRFIWGAIPKMKIPKTSKSA